MMIDQMKEVAIHQFTKQQEIIEGKNKEISLLIENKNKEVTTVIQERKRSLDEKSKEVTKITQEKDKEILKLNQLIASTKEDLLDFKMKNGENEIKIEELEEKITLLKEESREKDGINKRLEREIKESGDENIETMAKIKRDKENIIADKNTEMKKLTESFGADISKLKENLAHSKLDLAKSHQIIDELQIRQEKLGRF